MCETYVIEYIVKSEDSDDQAPIGNKGLRD